MEVSSEDRTGERSQWLFTIVKSVLANELCFKIWDVDLSSAIQRSQTGCGWQHKMKDGEESCEWNWLVLLHEHTAGACLVLKGMR
jgi:hypothetical protein